MTSYTQKYREIQRISGNGHHTVFVEDLHGTKRVAKIYPRIDHQKGTALFDNTRRNIKPRLAWLTDIEGIPHIIETFSESEKEIIIWEYIEGSSLGVNTGSTVRLRYEELLEMTSALLTVVQQLDLVGIIHGDIKPSNVIRTGNRWSLIDLDVAAVSGESQAGSMFCYDSVVMWAPERYSLKMSFISDLYSIALTMIMAFSGLNLIGLSKYRDTTSGAYLVEKFYTNYNKLVPLRQWIDRALLIESPFESVDEAIEVWQETVSSRSSRSAWPTHSQRLDDYRQIEVAMVPGRVLLSPGGRFLSHCSPTGLVTVRKLEDLQNLESTEVLSFDQWTPIFRGKYPSPSTLEFKNKRLLGTTDEGASWLANIPSDYSESQRISFSGISKTAVPGASVSAKLILQEVWIEPNVGEAVVKLKFGDKRQTVRLGLNSTNESLFRRGMQPILELRSVSGFYNEWAWVIFLEACARFGTSFSTWHITVFGTECDSHSTEAKFNTETFKLTPLGPVVLSDDRFILLQPVAVSKGGVFHRLGRLFLPQD